MTIKITFLRPNGESLTVDAREGWSLMEVAREHGVEEIEAICGGGMACATCHMILPAQWFEKLDPPLPEEEDMLEMSEGVERYSRLGCQVIVVPGMDGMTVRVPGRF